jgi:G3E family GTPase
VGCSLAASLVLSIKDFCKNRCPDFLFIEPSGMVVTSEIRNVTAMGRRDMAYDIGPFITLLEGPAFPMLWQERQTLLVGQLTGADLVAISKSELMDASGLAEIHQALQDYQRDAIPLSVHSGKGIKEVMQTLTTS